MITYGLGYIVALLVRAASSTGSMAAQGISSIDPVAQALIRHMAAGPSDAKPGDWISYRIDAGSGRVSFWRLSAVGAQKDALGRDALWIEVELGHHRNLRAPLLQMKMLVARKGLAAERVSRLLVAIGTDPPQEISPDRLRTLWHSPPRATIHNSGAEIIRAGKETRLMTHAGTIAAIPIEIYLRGTLVERIWMSHRMPLLGLAKFEMPLIGDSMEVTGFGHDAAPRMILPDGADPNIRLDRQPSTDQASEGTQ